MSNDRLKIAVIGGGASAAILMAHIMGHKNLSERADITVFDRTGIFTKGIAYSTQSPEHLLNVRAGNMSALENKPAHFLEWLRSKSYPYETLDFVPRMIYGEYLADILERAKNTLSLDLKTANVKGTRLRDDGAYEIATDDGALHIADIVIAATGNSKPFIPAGAEQLTPADGYHENPWRADYTKIPATADITILGTGLSMVDSVLSLKKTGFKGHITAISRHGLLPATHVSPAVWPAFIIDKMPESAYEILRLVRVQTGAAKRQNIPWQAVIDSLRPFTNRIWDSWGQDERQKFRRRLVPYWNIHRHRMAPQIAAVIDQLKQDKRLIIRSDVIKSISRAQDKILVAGAHANYEADHVINCLGYGAGGSLAPAEGANPNFYIIGPARSSTQIETTAIPEIREQAAEITKQILHILETGHSHARINPAH